MRATNVFFVRGSFFYYPMKFINKIFLTLVVLLSGLMAVGQEMIQAPYFAVATHPMTVQSIAKYPDSLVLVMTIENQSDKGYFCVNKKVYMEDLKTRSRVFMLSEKGLPLCPGVYHFKWKGEVKTFFLSFPSPDKKTSYVNVVEDCNDNCFAIYGLVLDKAMNEDINRAYDAYKLNHLEESLQAFEKVMKDHPDYPFGGFAAHVIKILLEQKKYAEAGIWYKKLQYSNFLDKAAVVKEVSTYSGFDRINQQ